jgi:leader peptidase (prepilin peptidase)/N-methyltransferase
MIYWFYDLSFTGAIHFVLFSLLLVISVIDLNLKTIPDLLTLPGIVLCVVASPLLPSKTIVQALIGVLAGGGILWIVAWVYERITGRQGMGGGDIKLLALIGGAVGWSQVPIVLFIASFCGSLYGLFLMVRHRVGSKHALPFGPFLCGGAVLVLFLGVPELTWLPWSNNFLKLS